MKKKQILFLFAASALFAACSSDELPTNNGSNEQGGGEETTEVTATSVSVQTSEGVGLTVGALDGAATKSESKGVYVNLPIYLEADQEGAALLKKWAGYIAKVDDFAVRKNGDYLEIQNNGDKEANWNSIILREIDNGFGGISNLGVEVTNLENLATVEDPKKTGDDYTFEFYLWIDNRQPANDGSGSYVDLFDQADKWAWIGGKDAHYGDDPLETGIDITHYYATYYESGEDQITGEALAGEWVSYAQFKNDTTTGKDPVEEGYAGQFNIYRGISGKLETDGGDYVEDAMGNTPYIKVSIHVQRVGSDVRTSADLTPVYPSAD